MHGKWIFILAIGFFLLLTIPENGVQAQTNHQQALNNFWSKLHPKFVKKLETKFGQNIRELAKIEPTASYEIEVIIRVKAGTDLSSFMERMAVRPFVDPLGMQAVIGAVKLGNLEKIISLPEVYRVQLPESIVEPPKPPDPDLPRKPSTQNLGPSLPNMGPQPTDWYEVMEVHRAKAAWAKGFTGKGVKVMVNDSGIDFCHPDLKGTWATADNGWPMMFDGYSMYLSFYDKNFGTKYIADGWADYADTSLTCSSSPCSYKPIGASAANNYTLPGTSKSGTYHIGSHPDKIFQQKFGERVAVLVVDENTPGVYDTVYVDLNRNYNFNDDTPSKKASPTACGTYAGTSYSGGLVYFIADGVHSVPASNWYYGLGAPGNGNLVAFALNDFTEGGGNHGQLCASAVAAQGIINGNAPPFKPLYFNPGDGMVVGGGKDAKLVNNGNHYLSPFVEDAFLFSTKGYDGTPNTADDIQIVSNSFGLSAVDNDGWDLESRLVEEIQRQLGPTLSILKSTGNGGPGYGTIAPFSTPSGIQVGASTEMGSTGWDSITSADQITYGDVIPFSNRGPGARGNIGVHVVAGGAFAAGDLPVNETWSSSPTFNLESAWDDWGGTSRSTPIAAGILALVYDAHYQKYGMWPTHETARAILMAGADNIHNDPLTMGAGMINADKATDIAGGVGSVYALPDNWSAGNYHGKVYPAFANIVFPGQFFTQTFTVRNTGQTSKKILLKSDVLTKSFPDYKFNWTTSPINTEDPYNFNRPNYLMNITNKIPQGTDLMVMKMAQPFSEFDTDSNYAIDNRWVLLAYDWTDVNSNGRLWQDNGNGAVNASEIDAGEYVRFGYAYNYATSQELRVQRPLERMHEGIFLGLIHRQRTNSVPISHLRFVLEFYKHQKWSWLSLNKSSLSIPPGGTATFLATLKVPSNAFPGFYQGAISIDEGIHQSTIPVAVNVATRLENNPIVLAGKTANDSTNGLYNNGVVRGHFNWDWRAESGDWRFFFIDVPEGQAPGSKLLVKTTWEDASPRTDIDTLIMGPTRDTTYSGANPDYYGPYRLEVIGKSPNKNTSAGVWRFDTSSGKAEDWVSAPLQPGLHLIAVHNVLYEGDKFDVPFTITVGKLLMNPYPVQITATNPSGTLDLNMKSNFVFNGFQIDAFGPACPETLQGKVSQGADSWHEISIDHCASLEVNLDGPDGTDLDLSLYDPDEQLVTSSAGSGPDEKVSVKFPENGTWWARVHGYSVPGGPASYQLTLNAMQGNDLWISKLRSRRDDSWQNISATLNYSLPSSTCESGLLLMGPTGGPGAVEAPVTISDCLYIPKSMGLTFSRSGGESLIEIKASGDNCNQPDVIGDRYWIATSIQESGPNKWKATISVLPNTDSTLRKGTVAIGGYTIPVTQNP